MNGLNAIFEHKMTMPEAEAFKIALLWEEELERAFPQEERLRLPNHNRLPKRTDPRKSALFRYCWKIRRELKDLIRSEEMVLFIRGNLTILKKHDACIDIAAMTGEKAWLRWKVYQRWFKQKQQETASTPQLEGVVDRKIVIQIDKSKKFIFEQCGGIPTFDKIKSFYEDGLFGIWISQDRISKYYVALSPFMKPYAPEIAKKYLFDLNLYVSKVSPGVLAYFKDEFAYEF